MKAYIAVITDGKEEWEEVFHVPSLLNTEETIKTFLSMSNERSKKNLKFLRIKKQRLRTKKQRRG